MRNVERIVGMIRTGSYPEEQITPLIEQDASSMVERVVSSANPATVRRHMVEFARQVYAAAAETVRREVHLRTVAATDAADAVARYEGQHADAVELVEEILGYTPDGRTPDDDRLTPEQWADIQSAPVFIARVLLRDNNLPPDVSPVEHALELLAQRKARVAELVAKAARS